MRKLIAVAALAAVTSASAIGVGMSGHYNIGMPLGDFADGYDMSIMGFQADVEIAVHPFINVVAAFGYQVFKPSAEGALDDDKFTLIPITFGIEYPAVFGSIAFYPGGGMSYNMYKATVLGVEGDSESKIGIWFGGNFYYMVNANLGIGAGAQFHYILTKDDEIEGSTNTMWLHIPIGIKYWFM
jgi:hypothetical protein